jgi:lysozyme family protein
MDADRFDMGLVFVLAREGGFVDDPVDRGGATNFGVTQRAYDRYCQRHEFTQRSVRDIEQQEVRAIYFEDYWTLVHADKLPPPLDLIMFDSAVQHGVSGATKLLQRALGVKVDGAFGPVTLKAAINYLADKVADQRRTYYKDIIANDPSQKRFENGWNNRMAALETAAGLA